MSLRLSQHAAAVIAERGILSEWIEAAVDYPDRTEGRPDGTVHHLKRVDAFGGRWLRVVMSSVRDPAEVVTAFFDRRVR